MTRPHTYTVDLDAVTGPWSAAHLDLPPPPSGFCSALVICAANGRVVIRSARVGRTSGVYAVWLWLRRHLGESHGAEGVAAADAMTFDIGRA